MPFTCVTEKLSNLKVGNVRLSNSAESVQYPARRPSTRRILLGANIPRQYPLRSSLRRHKERQKGTNNNNNATSPNSCTRPKSTTDVVAAGETFLGNPKSEVQSSTNNECCSMATSMTFKPPRL